VTDAYLVLTKRKPFDIFSEGLDLKNRRGNRAAIELFVLGLTSWALVIKEIIG
jgi:hypothetical protein